MEKDNPDLYKKLYEPITSVETLTTEVTEKMNLSEAASASADASAADATEESAEGDEKKHQSRGGKGLLRDESVKLDKEALKRAVHNTKM